MNAVLWGIVLAELIGNATPEDHWELRLLLRARMVGVGHVGDGGDIPRELVALHQWVRSPHAREGLMYVLEEAGPAGRFFAMAGLRHVDPEAFRARLAALQSSESVGFSGGGCGFAPRPLSELLQELAEGSFDDRLHLDDGTPEQLRRRRERLDTLLTRAQDPDPRTRADAALGLGYWLEWSVLEPSPHRLLPALWTLLDDPTPEVRAAAARALCDMSWFCNPDLARVTEAFDRLQPGVDDETAESLCLALALWGCEGALLDRIEGDDSWLREHALEALGNLWMLSDTGAARLWSLHEAPDPFLRRAATDGARDLESAPEAVRARLEDMATNDPDPNMRDAAAWRLKPPVRWP